jgi:DNA-binding NarL/FixJ family response regulator
MSPTRIPVAIVEDNAGTRDVLKQILNRSPRLRFVGAWASGEEAIRALPAAGPEVALVDINLPGMSGIECVARLKQELPDLHVLMLTSYEETDLIFESLRAGAIGYLLKNVPNAELISAIEEVHDGGAPMSMQIARKVVRHFHGTPQRAQELGQLTKREQEILALLAKGFLYKEIAERLGISSSTVRGHLHNIYEKLHVQSRTEAVVKYLKPL